MKRLVLIALTLFMGSGLQAQQTGNAVIEGREAGRTNSMQNWIFAGGGLAAVTAGVIVIFVNSLNDPNVSHFH